MGHVPFRKLQSRVGLFVFLSTLPVIAVLTYHVIEDRNEAYNNSLRQAEQVVNHVIQTQVELANRSRVLLEGLAGLEELQSPSAPACEKLLQQVLHLNPDYSDFSVRGPGGIPLCYLSQASNDVQSIAVLQDALEKNGFAKAIETDPKTGAMGFQFAYPVNLLVPEQSRGVIIAKARFDSWAQQLARLSLPAGAVALVADAHSRTIAVYPENTSAIGSSVSELIGTRPTSLLYAGINGSVFQDKNGQARVLFSQSIGGIKNSDSPTLYVGIPLSLNVSGITPGRLGSTFLLLVFASLFYLAAMVSVRKTILEPIGRLIDASKKLEQGELEWASDERGVPELVELQNSFLRMARTKLESERQFKMARQKLIESQLQINSHIENTPLGYVFWDRNFICTGWNKTCEQLFGYPAEEAIGRHGTELIVSAVNRSEVDGVFAQLLKQEGGTHNVNENVAKDGSVLICDWYNTPIEDGEGNVVGVASFMQDITARIKSAEESKRTNDLLEYSQTAAKVGGWEIDLATGAFYWTAETFRIYDTTPEEFNPTVDSRSGYFLPESQVILDAAVNRAITDGVGYELELETYTFKGRLISVFTTCTVTMEDGKPAKLTGIFQDITEQKAAKIKLQREQLRTQSILATAADGIISIDNRGHILSFNSAAEKIFGWTAFQVLGKNLKMLMPEPYQSEHDGYLAHYNETGEAKVIGVGQEMTGKRADGSHFPLHLAVSEWVDGEEQLFTGLVRDVTNQKEIQTQLIQTQKMGSLTQLSGGLAHDFNNLLAIIIGNLDFLEGEMATGDENLQRVQSALRAADRGAEITRRMLRFSRLQTNHEGILAPQNISELLSEMVEILRRTLGSSFEVALDCEAQPAWARIDPAEFENVVLNLGLNARDAMPDGGQVTISVHNVNLVPGDVPGVEAGNWIRLTFADTGHGMTQELQGQIFEPFFTTKAGKGSGLGLAMAYGFAQQNGGNIQVSSEMGKGTRFTLYLPASSLSTSEPINTQIPNLKGGSESVLIVDDEIELLGLTEIQLQDLGYSVRTASNAAQALEILEKHQDIELLITDIVMPGGMLGTELAATAQRHRPELRILLISGFTRQVTEDPQYKRFDELILSKPFRKSELAQRVREVLEN